MTASASPSQQEQPNVYTLHIRLLLCDCLYYNYSIRPLYSNVSAFNKDQLLPSFCSIHYLALTLDYPYVHHSIKHYFQALETPHGTSSMWAFSCYHPTDFRWDSCIIYSCTALLGIFQDRPILMAFIFPDFKSLQVVFIPHPSISATSSGVIRVSQQSNITANPPLVGYYNVAEGQIIPDTEKGRPLA